MVDDLFGLEDYVLSTNMFADIEPRRGLAYAVRGAIQCKLELGHLEICVGQLRGLTAAGQPVLSTDQNPLKTSIEIRKGSEVAFNLSISVNGPFETNNNGSQIAIQNDGSKLSLIALPSENKDHAENAGSLFLGEYVWKDQMLVMKRRPVVMRLVALKTLDVEWKEWTQPLKKALIELFEDLNRNVANNSATHAASALLHKLAFAWPYLSVPKLAFELQILNWIRWLSVSGSSFALFEHEMVYEALPELQYGDELPQILADMIHPDNIPMADSFLLREGENEDYVRDAKPDVHLVQAAEDIRKGSNDLVICFLKPKKCGVLAIVVEADPASSVVDHPVKISDQRDGQLDVKGAPRGKFYVYRKRFSEDIPFEHEIRFEGISRDKKFQIYFFPVPKH